MTKPIEWTTTENMPVIFWHRMHVDESGELRDATPSDLVAALAAMGEGERAEVLEPYRFANTISSACAKAERDELQVKNDDLRTCLAERKTICEEAIKRAEDAERERDRMAREFGTRPGELPDDGEIARVVRERAEFRDRAEKAERERDEARLDLARALKSNTPYSVAADEAIRDRDAALGERNRAQAERDTERACRLENEAELHRVNKELGDLRTRLIAALKAERDDARLRCGAALATAATATARADTAAASHLASAGLVAEFRGRLAAAESALDVAQSRAVRAEKLADEALADRDRARASLDIVRHDLRGTRAEVDALRSRLIAAETAAAQREPREYPLAEGSRWDGDEIVDLDGTRTSAVGCTGGAHIWCVGPWGEKRFPRLADVLALAHRRGLL